MVASIDQPPQGEDENKRRSLETFNTFSERFTTNEFLRTKQSTRMVNKMCTMDIDEYLSSDDEDGAANPVANEEETKTDAYKVKETEDYINDGDEDEELKEFSTWKVIVLGGVLGIAAVYWKDCVNYFYGDEEAQI